MMMPKVREDEIFARIFEEHGVKEIDKQVVDMIERFVHPTWRVFDDTELYIVEDNGDGAPSDD